MGWSQRCPLHKVEGQRASGSGTQLRDLLTSHRRGEAGGRRSLPRASRNARRVEMWWAGEHRNIVRRASAVEGCTPAMSSSSASLASRSTMVAAAGAAAAAGACSAAAGGVAEPSPLLLDAWRRCSLGCDYRAGQAVVGSSWRFPKAASGAGGGAGLPRSGTSCTPALTCMALALALSVPCGLAGSHARCKPDFRAVASRRSILSSVRNTGLRRDQTETVQAMPMMQAPCLLPRIPLAAAARSTPCQNALLHSCKAAWICLRGSVRRHARPEASQVRPCPHRVRWVWFAGKQGLVFSTASNQSGVQD